MRVSFAAARDWVNGEGAQWREVRATGNIKKCKVGLIN
jgi:hypothetical protein